MIKTENFFTHGGSNQVATLSGGGLEMRIMRRPNKGKGVFMSD
jgi:hypothetical protein